MKRTLTTTALLILIGAVSSPAAQTVRELWDNVDLTAAGSLQGATNGNTSFGFLSGSSWTVNAADTAVAASVLQVTPTDAIDDFIGVYPMLPASITAPATLGLRQANTNGWDSGNWATRFLDVPSRIKLNANGV